MDAYEITEKAKDNVAYYMSNTSEYQDVAMDDTRFTNGDQWTDASKSQRGKRPQSVVNDAPAYKRKVKEFYKRRQSSIKVTPVDNDNDPKSARAFQGIVDQVMRTSLGDACLDKAFDDVLTGGSGFCYVDAEYENEKSFDQNLTLNHISDPFSVFYDLNFKKMTRQDMDFGGWLFTMGNKDYKEKYGEDKSSNGFSVSAPHFKQNKDDVITLCRYYEREYVEDTLINFLHYETKQNINVLKSELTDEKYDSLRTYYETEDLYAHLKETNRILASRSVDRPEIKWYIMNDSEVLSEGKWAGKYIPLIPMLGEEYRLEGNTYYASLVRWMKDPARLYNYYISNMAETLALKPLAPLMATPEQVKGFEHMYANSNNNPTPYLLYNNIKSQDGTILSMAPPIETTPAQVPSGLATMAQMADVDKKNTIGIQDVAMGMDGQENSGRAILARSDESLDNVSTFIDSRRFTTHYLGMVLVDLIPKYYDAPRTIRILGSDAEQEIVRINDEGAENFLDIKGIEYDIYIDEGPSFASQRKESQASFLELAKVMGPQYMSAFADKMVEYMDIKDAKEVAKRITKMMPQEIFVEEGENTPEAMQAQMTQMTQQAEQQKQTIDELTKMLMAEQQGIASSEKKMQAKINADLQKEELKIDSNLKLETIKQRGATEREHMSNQTDIKEAEIDAQTSRDLQMMKMMEDMKKQIDSIAIIKQR